jgi:hypothetical protein
MMEGVNLPKIHCRTFVNVTVHPQYNNSMLIKKNKGQVKQVLAGGWYQWKEGGQKESKYGGNTVYSCMKMEH